MKLHIRYVFLIAVCFVSSFLLILKIVGHDHDDERQTYEAADDRSPVRLKTGNVPSGVHTTEVQSTPSYGRQCRPQDNIVFLKTQRCASSTLQNILYRWGDKRNLSFVLPWDKWPYMGNPELFEKKFAIESADGVYNILANHARFSEKGIAEIMPNNSIYISILRNPVAQFESVYVYDQMRLRFGVDVRTFLRHPLLYYQREPLETHIAGRNSMMYDLGLDARALDVHDAAVTDWIQKLEQKFNLVLITEYLPESLILLKDTLCWSMEDILHLKQNARQSKNRTLSENLQMDIRNWNSVDVRLYEHFNRTLWRKIEAYGVDRMKKEVAILKMKKQMMQENCVKGVMQSGDNRIWYPTGVKIESFQINPNATDLELCSRVTRPENVYLQLLQERHHRRNALIRGVSLSGVKITPTSIRHKSKVESRNKKRKARRYRMRGKK